MLRQLLSFAGNVPGWHTNRKIVVFESDDWGSIRIPSKASYEHFVQAGISVDTHNFTKYDSLESAQDINKLCKVLSDFKDKMDNHPVFTTLNIMANPDIKYVLESQGELYRFQPFRETYIAYDGNDHAFHAFEKGIQQRVLFPQLHGREHLQVKRWMAGIQNQLPQTMLAAQWGCTGLNVDMVQESRRDYQAAFDYDSGSDLAEMAEILSEATDMFEAEFGFKSKYFVPPNGLIHHSMFPLLKRLDIQYLSTGRKQMEPIGGGKFKTRFRYLGKKDASGLRFVVRNAFFEPSADPSADWVAKCVAQIATSFQYRKPAVISTHRVNYISRIDTRNSEMGLAALHALLQAILLKWPDIEFMTTVELADLISGEKV